MSTFNAKPIHAKRSTAFSLILKQKLVYLGKPDSWKNFSYLSQRFYVLLILELCFRYQYDADSSTAREKLLEAM